MKPLLLVLALFLAGCDRLQREDYQFVTTTTGEAYVFHPKTGKVSLVSKDGLHLLQDATPMLRIGEYYELQDGTTDARFVKYLGGGKFEPAKYSIRKVSE